MRRAIVWGAAGTAGVVLIAGGVVGLAIKRIPADYRPLTLGSQQKQLAIHQLHMTIMEFLEVTGRIGSHDPRRSTVQSRHGQVELSAEQLNRWIASLPPEATAALERIGLRDPAVAIDDGQLSLYAHWDKHNAVLGIDLALVFGDDQRMTIDVRRARLGAMPVPDRIVAKHRGQIIGQLRDHVRSLGADPRRRFGPLPMEDLARASEQLIDTLDGIPVRLDIPRRYGHARVCNIRLVRDKAIVELISLLPE